MTGPCRCLAQNSFSSPSSLTCPLRPLLSRSKPSSPLDAARFPAFSVSSPRVSSKNKLRCRLHRVSCFIHKDSSNGNFGFVEPNEELDKINGGFGLVGQPKEEPEKPELEKSSVENDGLILRIRKVFNSIFRLHGEPWTVPWTAETIVQVMLLWIASFWFVGSWIIPFLAHAAGFSKETLTHRGQALYSLLTDIAEGLAGVAILHRCLSRFQPLPAGWFSFTLKGTWHFDVILGCLLFPLVNFLSHINVNMVPALSAPPVGVSSVEQSIVARDPVAMALYAVVVTVCAPLWEEIVFRGFLLPSLTRYLPVPLSIVVSAVAFALAHFNVQRLLPLVFLGVVMGTVFARSRNLLASMLLHSLWNGFVFLDLMK